MKKLLFTYTVLVLSVCSMLVAKDVTKISQDFSLMGNDGKEHSLADYDEAKAVVVMFISAKCPVSNGFNERMVELAGEYESKDVVFLGVYSNKAEKMNDVKDHAEKNGFPFVVLKDENNVIADQFQAKVTPEVYVLNSDHKILYHGRIDDSAAADERKSQDLKKALDEILSGTTVSTSSTKAFGCSIKRISM